MNQPEPEIKPMESLRVFPSPTMALDPPPLGPSVVGASVGSASAGGTPPPPPLPQGEVKLETAPGLFGSPNLVFPRKARDFWQEKLASSAGGSPSNENFPLASNFSSVEKSKDPNLSDPYDKPVESPLQRLFARLDYLHGGPNTRLRARSSMTVTSKMEPGT